MKKITFILYIAILTACGGKNQEAQASNSVQNSNEPSNKEAQSSESNSKTAEPQEQTDCGASRLLVSWDDPDPAGTNIRNSPSGKVIATIYPNEFEDGCMLEIVEASNGWFRIQGAIQSAGNMNDIVLPNNEGWIHNSVISVGTRNYGGQTIDILDSPKNGNSVGKITKESYGLRVLDLCGDWVKINYKGTIGWVSNEWICGIPWTTCN
jgi:SH3-like domain-containing protein